MSPSETSAIEIGSRGRTSSAIRIALGPILAAAVYIALERFTGDGAVELALPEEARRVAGVLAWMAVWWLTEAVPLPATSLLPLVALPMTGAGTLASASSPYASRIIFLFMGGFMLAIAMEKWNLHKRIALIALTVIGCTPTRMIAGFMITSAVLSMWVSNTATTVMMLPIATSVIALVRSRTGGVQSNFSTALMLGIAYSASIGGLATPIGSPPNAILLGYLNDSFGYSISFTSWMMMGLPITIVFLPITWALLTKVLYRPSITEVPGGRAMLKGELASLGPMSRGEWAVLAVFMCTVLAWLTRGFVAGSSGAIGSFVSANIDDASIAIAASIVLFAIPVDARRGRFVLDWQSAAKLPWGVLLLFGGGLSLAGAIKSTGLDSFIGSGVLAFENAPTLVVVLLSVATVVFLTELTSNTATATIFISILTGVAITGFGIDPLLLIVPATFGASCAFMMPVATPPNAIVYGTGHITIRQMARAGFLLNLVSIALATIAVYTVGAWVLGIDPGVIPEWAQGGTGQ